MPGRVSLLAAVVLLTLAVSPSAMAQPAAKPAAKSVPRVRKLAPGVLTVIKPELKEEETFTHNVNLVDLSENTDIQWTPQMIPGNDTLVLKARNATLRRRIWGLEFTFKPLRMIYVDVPQPTGVMKRQLIWYMVYRVRNLGKHLAPEGTQDRFGLETFGVNKADFSVRFFPMFSLVSQEVKKEYPDRILPIAAAPIQRREKIPVRLKNTVEMTLTPVPVNENGVWGVVTWEHVDPRIDYFSILVEGLTNALVVDNGKIKNKTLQLNFWRPGDTAFEHEDEIRYGVPVGDNESEMREVLSRYGIEKRLDHLWIYR